MPGDIGQEFLVDAEQSRRLIPIEHHRLEFALPPAGNPGALFPILGRPLEGGRQTEVISKGVKIGDIVEVLPLV